MVYADTGLSEDDAKSILNQTTFYQKNGTTGTGTTCAADGTDPTIPTDTNGDAQQIGFNYFVGKGLSDVQAAAIIGNFMQESHMNPNANQAGGPGMGIAQWSSPGRWDNLLKFAKLPVNSDLDPFSLGLQLAFVWQELTGKPPAGDYTDVLTLLQQQTDIEEATGYFMGTSAAKDLDPATSAFMARHGRVGGYENPGTPQLGSRIEYAKNVLSKYGGTATGAVTGTTASCGSVGSVDCSNSGTATDSSLSSVRQNVVCLTRAELELWKNGDLKPGPQNDFYKYSDGVNNEWCAYFASWIYAKANYPFPGTPLPLVMQIHDVGVAGGKFTYHASSGYTPVPGDLAIHEYSPDSHHVNIVVSVNANKKTMVAIGGNQAGTSTANNSSKVSAVSYNSFTTDSIIGYVSPVE
jgi:hypothetical protein